MHPNHDPMCTVNSVILVLEYKNITLNSHHNYKMQAQRRNFNIVPEHLRFKSHHACIELRSFTEFEYRSRKLGFGPKGHSSYGSMFNHKSITLIKTKEFWYDRKDFSLSISSIYFLFFSPI